MDDFVRSVYLGTTNLNKIAIGKRIAHEEKKAGRDLTGEINPFTGGRM